MACSTPSFRGGTSIDLARSTEIAPDDLVGAAIAAHEQEWEAAPPQFRFLGVVVSGPEVVVWVTLSLAACAPSATLEPKARICEDLSTVRWRLLDTHLPERSPLSAGASISVEDCEKVALNVAFVDGYLQGLDRGWSAVAPRDQIGEALAEAVVGAWIGVSVSCRAGQWEDAGAWLEQVHKEVDRRLQARLGHCEG